MNVRPVRRSDRDALHALLRSIEQFKPEEVAVAEELIDASIEDAQGSGYETLVAEADGAVGYLCYGKTPMTAATFDLYWIAVHPARQGQGIGRALYTSFAEHVRSAGGAQVRIETSSKESYAATGGFYERLGFRIDGRLRDFYAPGDDLLIFYRQLDSRDRLR